ncbi:MAG TPA: peptidylprolyl isomerase [Anaeromyxobacter sp.]
MSVLALVAALLWSGAPNEVVARVDGTTITGAAFARRLEATASTYRTRPEQILDTMIDEALLATEGRRLGLEGSPIAKARFEFAQRTEAGAVFLRKEIEGRIAPDEKNLRSLFHSTADFAAFELLTFDTTERASAALGRIRKGAPFAAEAPGAITSGLHPDPKTAPLVMRGELDARLAAALFDAAPGAVVGPVALREGFGIARLLNKVVGTDAAFAQRRASIASHARQQLADQMKTHVLAQLRERAHVSLDEAFLRSVEGEPTSQQLDHVLATTGGRALRYGEIVDEVSAIRAMGGHMGAAMRISVAWREIDARLLEDVAVERGFLNAPEVIALRKEHQQEGIGYAAAMRLRNAAPAPSERDIASFYERNSAEFGRPFGQVLPQAAAGAAREKRGAALLQGIAALRTKAAISIDRAALARAAQPGA